MNSSGVTTGHSERPNSAAGHQRPPSPTRLADLEELSYGPSERIAILHERKVAAVGKDDHLRAWNPIREKLRELQRDGIHLAVHH